MGNPTTIHKQKAFLSPVDKELFNKNGRSAINYYWDDHIQKLIKVTDGSLIHDYINRKGVNHD